MGESPSAGALPNLACRQTGCPGRKGEVGGRVAERVAVITGGTGGLGTALIKRLIDRDVRFAVTYLLPDEAAAFEDEFDLDEDRLILRRVDAVNAEAVNSFMKEVTDTWGGIHHLCSLVGGWAGGRDVEETDDVRFERMLDL